VTPPTTLDPLSAESREHAAYHECQKDHKFASTEAYIRQKEADFFWVDTEQVVMRLTQYFAAFQN
jgi:hypothetical protein